jgi:hypothetical protein
MSSIVTSPRQSLASPGRVVAIVCMLVMLCPAPRIFAASLSNLLSVKLLRVSGEASNTITSLEFINDVTLQIEAVQVGYLSHFGNFTGDFSYLAVASPTSIALLGNATLTNDVGEQLFLTATVLELGAGYPYQVTGTLLVTGGTGHFAGATGTIVVTGVDGEELTDTFKLAGTLLTVK